MSQTHSHPALPLKLPNAATPVASGTGISWVLLVLNGSLIAAIYAVAKQAVQAGVPFATVFAGQVGVAAVIVAIALRMRGEPFPVHPRHIRYGLVAGLIGVTGPNLVTFAALAHLPAGVIGALTSLAPVFTYAIAIGLRLESLKIVGGLGVVFGLLGAVLIADPDTADLTSRTPWLLLALCSPLLLACGNVYRSVAWPRGLTPMGAAAVLLLLQCLVGIPVAAIAFGLSIPSNAAATGIPAVLAAGLLMAAFYMTAFELQRRAGPVLVGQLGNVISVASLAIGAVWLGERYESSTLVGAVIVVSGVLLVTWSRRDAGPPVAESSSTTRR